MIKLKIKKSNWLKIYTYTINKDIKIDFVKKATYKPKILINPNHIFFSNGYQTILTSDTVNESINPLDLKSCYDKEKFKVAIETKLIQETFNELKTSKIDFIKVMLIVIAFLCAFILYFITKS